MSGDRILQEILESDWTLAALKRREDARRSSERGSSRVDGDIAETRRAHDGFANNWVAEAFRRRQEEERAKAARHQSLSAHTASKEVPVDNWLIEGFKRHQQEERRRETIARPDEAEAAAVSDDHSISDLVSSSSEGGVAERVRPSEDLGSADQPPAGANVEAPATALAPLVSRDDGAVLDKPPRRAGRIIMIAGLVVVGGLVSVIAVKSLLFGSGGSTKSPGPPRASPPTRQEKLNRSQGASPKAERLGAPAAKPMEHGSAPKSDAPPHPSGAAPAAPSDAATVAAPPAETRESSKPDPVAPGGEQGSKARSPSQEHEQGDKALPGHEAAPAATQPAPAPRAATEAASPAQPDKNPNAEPTAVAPERSREPIKPDPKQNASESKRGAANSGGDAKPRHQAKDRNASHQAARKTDGLSTFLKRTANSVRKFFGRLGERQ